MNKSTDYKRNYKKALRSQLDCNKNSEIERMK